MCGPIIGAFGPVCMYATKVRAYVVGLGLSESHAQKKGSVLIAAGSVIGGGFRGVEIFPRSLTFR